MKGLATTMVALCSAVAFSQAPDVRVKLDATLSYRTEDGGSTNLRPYSFDGRPSLLAVTVNLDSGYRGYVGERLSRIPGDPDPSLLDEYYFEDPGLWRVGKQILPFGGGRVFRESALGVRGDTNLIFEGLPVSVVACDAGTGLVRGVAARIGSRIGLSVFLGEHFGISSGSLTQIREPEASPGAGHGYQNAIDLDGTRRFGKFELKGEVVTLSGGATPTDKDIDLADGTVSYFPSRGVTLTAGYTYEVRESRQFLRFGGALPITRGVQFEPWIRFKDNALWDISLQIRVRL